MRAIKAEIKLNPPTEEEQFHFQNITSKHVGLIPASLRLEGVAYTYNHPYTTAIVRLSAVKNSRRVSMVGIGTSKFNPVDLTPRSVKGRSTAFPRAITSVFPETLKKKKRK